MTDAPLIDRAHLAAQTGGDAELARELLDLFRTQCERLVPGITDAGLPGPQRADLAHTLKGSALGVGAGPVATCAARIEDALRSRGRDPGGASADLAQLVAATLAEMAAPS